MASESLEKRMEELFGSGGFLCAESVVKVIAESGGRESDDMVRAATGFCSGASRTCGQCGAVSGAIMGIGLYAGRSEPGADLDPTYALVQEFLGRFREQFESVNCFELIGCDFATPEGQERFKGEGLKQRCVHMAASAADMALSILREHGYLPEESDFIRSRLAPCGLVCGKCAAYAGGPIQRMSEDLRDQLGPSFGEYAKRFAGMNPVFENYPAFAELLEFLAAGSCTGCREQGCLFQSCRVAPCVREHGVDFCFECQEFPCDIHGMPERLAAIWRGNNQKMQESGAREWYRKIKDKPRYP